MHSNLTFDQSSWLPIVLCALAHVLLVRPLVCVLNTVKTGIDGAFPGPRHGQGMALI